MSTRANVIVTDKFNAVHFYRHSDGYPDCTGADLEDFVQGYKEGGGMRRDAMQSSGWLVVRGHFEYKDTPVMRAESGKGYDNWKVGAYEPCGVGLMGDSEYLYVIDLDKGVLEFRKTKADFWDCQAIFNTTLIKEVRF